MKRTSLAIVCIALLWLSLIGCARGVKPAPLAAQFGAGTAPPRSQQEMAADPLSGSDQPGALYENARVDVQGSNPPPNGTGVQPLSRTVQENVTAPGARSA